MTSIPQIIHQIWLGPLRPPVSWMETVRKQHPHWQYFLWTEENMPRLRNQRQFEQTHRYSGKANILRYELLHEFGGVYIDADIYCLKPLDPLLDTAMFAGYEGHPDYPDLVATSIMGAIPHHPNMNKLIEGIPADIPAGSESYNTSGPFYLTKMIQQHQMDIHLYPAHFFYPIHHGSSSSLLWEYAPTCANFPESYTIQYWGSTLHSYRKIDRLAKRLYHMALRRYYNPAANEYDVWFDRLMRTIYRKLRDRDNYARHGN